MRQLARSLSEIFLASRTTRTGLIKSRRSMICGSLKTRHKRHTLNSKGDSRAHSATRAIIVVDIFGQPYDAYRINQIAEEHDLWVIEDAAQAPHVKYKGRFAG